MRNSQHSVSLGTFGLAFAIVLSPAFMQSGLTFTSCKTGDTRLSELVVEVSGQDQIASFDSELRIYDVWLSSSVDSAVVRAIPMDLGSQVWVNYYSDAGGVGLMQAEIGGGEVALDVEPGLSTLMVYVKAPGGASDDYTVSVHTGCSDCDDGDECTEDSCDLVQQICVHDYIPSGGGQCVSPCTEQGILDAIAVGGGPHTFDCAGPTTVVTADTIVIDNDVILDGAGLLTVDGLDGSHSVFTVTSDVTAELRGFFITHSAFTSGWWWGGGGIVNEGTLAISNSTVAGNYGAWADCSGARPPCWTFGGGILNTEAAALTLFNSTVLENNATDGGGILNLGTATLINSTVSGNHATNDDGILNLGTATLTNATVSADRNPVLVNLSSGNVIVTKSIVDGGCGGNAPASNGYNIESPGNTCGFDQTTDASDVTTEELGLGPLADNGGTTPTHALLPGSVAIDSIPEASCDLTTDQRGVTRPQGGVCDVGAFEYADCSGSICDDGNECTTDNCDPLSGDPWCINSMVPDGLSCDAGGLTGVCAAGTCIENHCAGFSPCDDGSECTIDSCDPLADPWCSNIPVPDATACDFNGLAGVCAAGTCIENHCTGVSPCDDASECTVDVCDPVADPWCSNTPVSDSTACDAGGLPGVCGEGVCLETSWGTPESIGNGGDAGSVQLAIDPNGDVIAVWHQSAGTPSGPPRFDIWSSRYRVGLGWGTPELIEPDDTGRAYADDVAVSPNGDVIAVWHQAYGTRDDIWSNRYTAATGWGTPEPVETNDQSDAGGAQVAVDPNGDVIAVWHEHDGTRDDIWSNRYTPGVGWGTPELIEHDDTADAFNAQLVADPTGHVTAVWPRWDGGVGAPAGIWSNRYTPGVGWGTPEPLATDYGPGPPLLVADPTGHVTAVWPQSAGLLSERYTLSVGWGGAELVDAGNAAGSLFPADMGVSPNGDVIAAWTQSGVSAGKSWSIIWSKLYTPGVGWGTAEVIGSSDSGFARDVQLAVDPNGHATAVWEVGNHHIWSNRYTPGVGWGTAVPVGDSRGRVDTLEKYVRPRVVVDAGGQATAVWGRWGDLWSNRTEVP